MDEINKVTLQGWQDWRSRAGTQKDPYARFFMLYVAAIVSQNTGDNEYKKLDLFGQYCQEKYEDINKRSSDRIITETIDIALDDMVQYIQEHRLNIEIQNLNNNIPAKALKFTIFMDSNNRLQNAISSIYVVRNNLFHGDKPAYGQNDLKVVILCNSILEAVFPLLLRV